MRFEDEYPINYDIKLREFHNHPCDPLCVCVCGEAGSGFTLTTCDASNLHQQWTVELAIAPPAPPAPPTPALTLLSFAAKPDDKIFGFGEHQQVRYLSGQIVFDRGSLQRSSFCR